MPDKKLVAGLTIDTGNSRQNLGEVTEGLAASGEAGVLAANEITKGLQAIESGTDRTVKKIDQFKTVSDSDLQPLATAFERVQRAVIAAFGSIEAAPEAVQRAMQTATVQIEGTAAAVRAVGDASAVARDQLNTEAKAAALLAEVQKAASLTAGELAAQTKALSDDARSATGEVDKLLAELDKADGVASLEGQKAALTAIRDAIIADTQEYRDLGVTGADAVVVLQEKLKAVEGRLQGLGGAAREASASFRVLGAEAATGFKDLDEQIELTAAAVVRFDLKVKQGTASEKDVARITRAHEELREKIIQTYGAIEQGAPEAVAAYQKLETEIERTTEKANALVNAAKDQGARFLETGNRIQGVAAAVQGLSGSLGGTAAQIGNVAGQAGFLAAGIEQAKDAVAGLNLNTLQLSEVSAAGGIQVAALAASLFLGATAGLKFAETNAENEQEINSLTESAKTLSSELRDNLINQLGGVQREGAKVVGALESFRERLGAVPLAESKNDLSDVVGAWEQYAAALAAGTRGVDRFTAAQQAGLPVAESFRQILDRTSGVVEFHRAAMENGAAGTRLWEEAAKRSEGTAKGLSGAVADLWREMDRLSIARHSAEVFAEEHAKKTAAEAAEIRKADMATRSYAVALTTQQEAVTKAGLEAAVLERAHNGTTAAINQAVTAIRTNIGASDQNAVSLRLLATALQQVTNGTDGLTAKERERLQVIVEMAQRGETLTDVERKHVAQLAASVVAGEKVTGSIRAQLGAAKDLTDAMSSLVEAVKADTAATAANETATQRAAKAAESALAANKDLTSADRARYQSVIDLAAEIEALRKTQEAATKAEKDAADVTKQGTAEQRDRLAAIRERIAQMEEEQGATEKSTAINLDAGGSLDLLRMKEQQVQHEMQSSITTWNASTAATQKNIEEKTRQLEQAVAQTAANAQLGESAQKVQAVIEDGRQVWTNVTDDQRSATESVQHLKNTTTESATSIAADMQTISTAVAAAHAPFSAFVDLMREVNAQVRDMKQISPDAAEAVRKLGEAAAAAAGGSSVGSSGGVEALTP